MTKRLTGRARRMAELRETAEGLRRSGLMTSTDYGESRVVGGIHFEAANHDG